MQEIFSLEERLQEKWNFILWQKEIPSQKNCMTDARKWRNVQVFHKPIHHWLALRSSDGFIDTQESSFFLNHTEKCKFSHRFSSSQTKLLQLLHRVSFWRLFQSAVYVNFFLKFSFTFLRGEIFLILESRETWFSLSLEKRIILLIAVFSERIYLPEVNLVLI